MTNQTDHAGRRLEELYDHCMNLPADERDPYLIEHAGDDLDLLRRMVRLEDPLAAGLLPTTGAESDSGFEFTSGTDFAKCRIIGQRGAGGMGAVYLALDLQNHDRRVALKVMRPALMGEQDRRRFFNETAALSRLVHPNIAQMYYWGIERRNDQDRPFFVMEYVDGQTLDRFLADHRPTRRQTIELLRKICLAVHHGHTKGVFHRDLKPSNILVTLDGEPKIIDFGISFTVGGESPAGRGADAAENVGTPNYMAPEVAAGHPFVPDPRTDVYCLGVVAFEALTGRRPGVTTADGVIERLEASATTTYIRRRISRSERENLRSADRSFSFDIACVVAKAMRLDVDGRYTDAGEFAEDLRRLVDLEPVKARPPSRPYRWKMFVRRNRLAVTTLTMLFAAVATAAVVFRVGEVRIGVANAAAHARAGELAEQRGNWVAAAEEYRAADDGGFPDRLKVLSGELRALDRLGRAAQAERLIIEVTRSDPVVARSPRFQIREGFFYWPRDPSKSSTLVTGALSSHEWIDPADRAFAEALTATDVRVTAAKLRTTLDIDPFNHDAILVLALCDLALGELSHCEQEGANFHRLYPNDGIGSALAAVAAALDGRRDDAVEYLRADAVPADARAVLSKAVDLIVRHRSVDELLNPSLMTQVDLLGILTQLKTGVASLGVSHLIIPMTFRDVFGEGNFDRVLATCLTGDTKRKLAQWPNGLGELAAGLLEAEAGRNDSAIRHYEAATTRPAPIDCRRLAALMLATTRAGDLRHRYVSPADAAPVVRADLDRLIALGGIHPETAAYEVWALYTAEIYGLYPQLQALTLPWFLRSPDDPQALYYMASAEMHIGDKTAAAGHYRRAIARRLPADLKVKATAALRELEPPPSNPTTAPAQ